MEGTEVLVAGATRTPESTQVVVVDATKAPTAKAYLPAYSDWAADIETTGLLEDMIKQGDAKKLHCLVASRIDCMDWVKLTGDKEEAIEKFLTEPKTLIMHNGISFDGEALKMFGFDVSQVTLVDTLLLSWYLEPNRSTHGLAGYGEQFGVHKPEVEDWEGLTPEEYMHRCTEDVKIQTKLWHYQKKQLAAIYGTFEKATGHINYLMWKGEQLRMQAENGWSLNEVEAVSLEEELNFEVQRRRILLINAMPQIPVKKVYTRPAKCFKLDGTLSVSGRKWRDIVDAAKQHFDFQGEIVVTTGYEKGNPNSTNQMKDWLFSLGWKPETFDYKKDAEGNDRKVPQINVKGREPDELELYGTLCHSIIDLFDSAPQLKLLDGLGKMNHRHSIVKGFLANVKNGKVQARAGGFTNTLRMKHRELVNLPSGRVEYGLRLRGLLVAEEGRVLVGSDLCSLEDRIKQHFQWPLDPEFVKTQMAPDFDPHLVICVMAELMTNVEAAEFKRIKALPKGTQKTEKEASVYARLSGIRGSGKGANYSCQYGAGVTTISRAAKCSQEIAKALHVGYWKMNWTIKAVAEKTVVKQLADGTRWQYNPISKMWYSLRSDKDRFSTLIQGTAAFVFDLWAKFAHKFAMERGLEFKLLGQFHDELILDAPAGMEDEYTALLEDAINKVSSLLKLNRELDCDVQFGKNYAEIH